MEFNATAQALKCPNCGREVKIENNPKDVVEHSLDVHILKTIKVSEKTSTSMECEGCGAMVEVDATSSATTCPYCGSHYVLSKKQIEKSLHTCQTVICLQMEERLLIVFFKKSYRFGSCKI